MSKLREWVRQLLGMDTLANRADVAAIIGVYENLAEDLHALRVTMQALHVTQRSGHTQNMLNDWDAVQIYALEQMLKEQKEKN